MVAFTSMNKNNDKSLVFQITTRKLAKTDVTTGKNTQPSFTPTSVSWQAASTFWSWMLGFQVGFSSDLGGGSI